MQSIFSVRGTYFWRLSKVLGYLQILCVMTYWLVSDLVWILARAGPVVERQAWRLLTALDTSLQSGLEVVWQVWFSGLELPSTFIRYLSASSAAVLFRRWLHGMTVLGKYLRLAAANRLPFAPIQLRGRLWKLAAGKLSAVRIPSAYYKDAPGVSVPCYLVTAASITSTMLVEVAAVRWLWADATSVYWLLVVVYLLAMVPMTVLFVEHVCWRRAVKRELYTQVISRDPRLVTLAEISRLIHRWNKSYSWRANLLDCHGVIAGELASFQSNLRAYAEVMHRTLERSPPEFGAQQEFDESLWRSNYSFWHGRVEVARYQALDRLLSYFKLS